MHMVHIGYDPRFISELVSPKSAHPVRSRLRSSVENRYAILVIHQKIGERAFSVGSHAGWNNLPITLKNLTDTLTFKFSLKTNLFKLAYNL